MLTIHRLSLRCATAAICAVIAASAWAGGLPAKPVIKIENPGTKCVAPAEEMRRNHMELLKHQRNLTMREGVRGQANAASLNACVECHASKTNNSVLGSDEHFCQSCHSYAAVKLDCWDCHQPKANPNLHGESPPRMMKFRASTDTIPLPASPLKGEEANSLPFKGKEANSLPFKGRVGEGMGYV
ncbi:MAG: hypothetical protein Q8O31_04135, partial [Rhodocyclaceae bacterium]|nr:hypothetical protein [Rhodocyclaceae bacterium]